MSIKNNSKHALSRKEHHPTKADAEKLAKTYEKDMVIVVHIDFKTRRFGYASYGQNKDLCGKARMVGNQIHSGILSGAIKI